MQRNADYGKYTRGLREAHSKSEASSTSFTRAVTASRKTGTIEKDRNKLRELYQTALRDARAFEALAQRAVRDKAVTDRGDVQDLIGNAQVPLRSLPQLAARIGIS